jgi:hypothetical protein
MKPNTFKSETDLVNYINRLPVSDREVKVLATDQEKTSCSEIVNQLRELAPRMFELRTMLVKGMGGLGNYKSFDRYVEVASTNLSEEHVSAYMQELEAIKVQVTELVDGGLNEDIQSQLANVQSKVAALKMIKQTVMGFSDRLKAQVDRVSSKYETLVGSLNNVKKTQKGSEAKAALQTAIDEFAKVQLSVESLGEDLQRYCRLQVAYNSAIMS